MQNCFYTFCFIGGNSFQNTQKIGCLSVLQESRCTHERNKIGNFTINGIPHKEVFELLENKTDPKRKDVKRILVNKKGILQIEFYDGEVWSRIF